MAGGEDPWQNGGMSARLIAIALSVAAGVAAIASTTAGAADTSVREGGIWKAVVPLKPMKGEFGNLDPIGVAVGARILADCSINWVNPDDGARYCFSSGTSLEYFLDRPHYNIERARAGWRKLNGQH
jgi:hypothetical protein